MLICVSSETKNVNVKVFNMITTLLKHFSCDCKCKIDSTTCNSNRKWNNDKCQHKCKNIIIRILAHISMRIGGI